MANEEPGSSPFFQLLNEINRAAENRLPLVALGMVVALPDICVSLISEDGRSDGARYKAWCADNLAQVFAQLTPDDLYSMRCGVLHNGRVGDLKNGLTKAIFMLPWNGNVFHDSRLGDAYFYNAVEFVRALTDAVHKWYQANRDDPTVRANTERLMQYRPDGFGRYVQGIAVIA